MQELRLLILALRFDEVNHKQKTLVYLGNVEKVNRTLSKARQHNSTHIFVVAQ